MQNNYTYLVNFVNKVLSAGQAPKIPTFERRKKERYKFPVP